MTPKVSFIIPYYNAGGTVMETLGSIWAQSFTDYDVWLVNDGSTDAHSLEVLKEIERDPRVKVLHQDNAGPSVARNAAIVQSRAEFIVPLDADDLIMPDAVSSALATMADEPDAGVVYGNLTHFGARTDFKYQHPFDIRTQLMSNPIAATALIRKTVFDRCGLYDEHLSKLGLEDWEFWIRVHEGGFRLIKVEEVFFRYRKNPESRTFMEANVHLDEIKRYIFAKHAVLLSTHYESLYYELKMTKETPDYRIGHFLMRPYRWVKRLFS